MGFRVEGIMDPKPQALNCESQSPRFSPLGSLRACWVAVKEFT